MPLSIASNAALRKNGAGTKIPDICTSGLNSFTHGIVDRYLQISALPYLGVTPAVMFVPYAFINLVCVDP